MSEATPAPRDPKTDPVIPVSERELDTTEEDRETTQDEETNQAIANDEA